MKNFQNIIRQKLKKLRLSLVKKIAKRFPEKQKLFILGLVDDDWRWQYEIRYKKFSYDEIFELFETQRIYPKNILSVVETIDYLVENNCSISRFGDGEEFLFNMLNDTPLYPELKQKLLDICAKGTNKNCLVCINNFNADNRDCPPFFRKHFTHYYSKIVTSDKLSQLKFSNKIYGDAYSLQFISYKENKLEYINKIKQIWNNRKILFVVNKNSRIINDKDCFNNTKQKEYLYIPSSNAYSNYKQIYNDILTQYDTSFLIYIEGGAMATVLSYELSQKGYQALDMGGFYSRAYCDNK